MDAGGGGGGGTDANNGTGPGQSFTAQIKPLFQTDGCLGCHAPGGQAGQYDLTSYMTAKTYLTGGANCSVITTAGPGKGHFASLTATDVSTIESWQTANGIQ